MKTAEDLAREYAEREASANEKLTLEPFGIEELKTYAYHDFLAGYNAREQWISVEDRLPDFDVVVLVYYTITPKKGDISHYIELGRLNTITTSKERVSPEWLDKDYQPIEPTHWMPLPNAPKP